MHLLAFRAGCRSRGQFGAGLSGVVADGFPEWWELWHALVSPLSCFRDFPCPLACRLSVALIRESDTGSGCFFRRWPATYPGSPPGSPGNGRRRQARTAVVDAPAGEVLPASDVGVSGVERPVEGHSPGACVDVGQPRTLDDYHGMSRRLPCLDQLEDPWGAPGNQRQDLTQAGPLDLAGLAAAVLGIGRPLRLASTSKSALSFPVA